MATLAGDGELSDKDVKELSRTFRPGATVSSLTHTLRTDKDGNLAMTKHDRDYSDRQHEGMGYDPTDAWWHYNGSYEAYVADVGKRNRWAKLQGMRRLRAKKAQT